MAAFVKLFPFWTTDQVRRIISKLKNEGVIYTGNYNKAGFDRTQWYALSENVLKMYQNSQMDLGKTPNGFGENPTPIPDINTDSKPYIKETYKESAFDEFWALYPKKKSKGQAEKAFTKLSPSPDLFTKILNAIEAAKLTEQWQKDGGQFIPYPATWLNAKGWEDEIAEEETDEPYGAYEKI